MTLSKYNSEKIANKIQEDIFKPSLQNKISVFLCGADFRIQGTIRHFIKNNINNNHFYNPSYELIFPEDLFDELLYRSNTSDLLTLENLLADSVDVIVIVLESPGSLAELGAFANNANLRSKMICVVDLKYKRERSFISHGPLKVLKKSHEGSVLYFDFDALRKEGKNKNFKFPNFSKVPAIEKLTKVFRQIKRLQGTQTTEITLLQLDKFLLPAIYVLEPVNRFDLISIVGSAMQNEITAKTATLAALSILTRKKLIEVTIDGYRLTELSKLEFQNYRQNRSQRTRNIRGIIEVDNLRLEVLNLQNRGKKFKNNG